MSLRARAITGAMWSGARKIAIDSIEFVLGIILARLLTPEEFGMIAIIMIVISISEVFVNSGFSQAIIRKPKCTDLDYSTAFIFNFAVGVLFFFLVYSSAGWLSVLFENPELKPIIKVLGAGLIVNAIALVQDARFYRQIDQKTLTKISVIASISSGVIAVVMAFTGFGVWSLVAKYLLRLGISSALLWVYSKWKLSLRFSVASFRELFGFGSRLLVSGIIIKIFQNLNYFVIGKYFTAADLGYYSRSELFKHLLSGNVASIITDVGYSALAKVQDEPERLKSMFRQLFKSTAFVIMILMAGLFATSDALIVSLIGEKWRPSVELLQIFCFLGMIQPLNTMNINLINALGRSDLSMRLLIIAEVVAFPSIFLGILFGLKVLILGRVFGAIIAYVIFNRYASRYTNYTIAEQLKDLLPTLILAFVMGAVVYILGALTAWGHWPTLIVQIFTGVFIVVLSGELFKINEYMSFKSILLEKFIPNRSN
jgi:O-antigen/teichoic acid export membrane protein